MGAWLSYGLGSENQNLPAFVVLLSQAHAINTDQPLFSRLWASGFLPIELPGRAFPRRQRRRCSSSTIRPGVTQDDPAADARRRRQARHHRSHDALRRSGNRDAHPAVRDGVPDADHRARLDGSVEGARLVFEMYGPESRKPGTFAANCLLARRLAERNVRFIQLYHRGWDQHKDLPRDLALQCRGHRSAARPR